MEFWRAAYISGVHEPLGSRVDTIPTTPHLKGGKVSVFVRLFTSAPASSSTFTASVWFSAAAHIRAV